MFLRPANDNETHRLSGHPSWKLLKKYPFMFTRLGPRLMKRLPGASFNNGERSLENFLWFVEFQVKYHQDEVEHTRSIIRCVDS